MAVRGSGSKDCGLLTGPQDMAATMHSIFTATNLDFSGALQKALVAAGLDEDGLAEKDVRPKAVAATSGDTR